MLHEYLGTIVVLLILTAVLAAAAFSVIRDRRKGKHGCGCGGCQGCTMRGECHKNNRRQIP